MNVYQFVGTKEKFWSMEMSDDQLLWLVIHNVDELLFWVDYDAQGERIAYIKWTVGWNIMDQIKHSQIPDCLRLP